MRSDTERLALLHGTTEQPQSMRRVHAGPVTAMLDGVDLRYVRIAGSELLRRVYVAVRDADWGTVLPAISGLELAERDTSFRLEFNSRHANDLIDFSWHGTILGDASGRLEYVLEGSAACDFAYGRIGVCLHHPWRELSGARFVARGESGEFEGVFPDLIAPQLLVDGSLRPLFPPFDRLKIELAGGGALLFEFEGALWETEDHRNWTDSNLKTYSTPLARGRPALLRAGQSLRQRIVMTPSGVQAPHVRVGSVRAGSVRLSVGRPTGTTVPAIGLGVDRDGHRPDECEADLLAALSPRHLRVEVRLDHSDWRPTLAAAQATADRIATSLEVALMLREEHSASLAAVSEMLSSGPAVDRVLVTVAGARPRGSEQTTPSRLVDLVRDRVSGSVPGASFIGGTEMYFAELNRMPPDPANWGGICYSITPQMHAFTDVDLVESLDAQAETVRSARALTGGKPVVVSPITLAPRARFYRADPDVEAQRQPDELPASVDARQASLYGAAWTAGSLKYLAESGASSVTYYESTGWLGVLERAHGTPLPGRFFSRPHGVFPLYHTLADACEWVNAVVLECSSTDPLTVVGLAVHGSDGLLRLLVANLTPRPLQVQIAGVTGALLQRRLNDQSAETARAHPPAFRAGSECVRAEGALPLALAGHEVVRLDGS